MIKSVNYDQAEILLNIMELNGISCFDADITYGNGSFYKNSVPEPSLKFDISPQVEGVIKCSSDALPIEDSSLSSIVFDPPFLTYVKEARDHNSIMAKRFGGYWRYDDLMRHYKRTIDECYRVSGKKGKLIFKCQDIVHNHKLQPTHINIINYCAPMFRLKDMFILAAKSRMPIPQQEGTKKKVQKHARIHHSYFLVLERK